MGNSWQHYKPLKTMLGAMMQFLLKRQQWWNKNPSTITFFFFSFFFPKPLHPKARGKKKKTTPLCSYFILCQRISPFLYFPFPLVTIGYV